VCVKLVLVEITKQLMLTFSEFEIGETNFWRLLKMNRLLKFLFFYLTFLWANIPKAKAKALIMPIVPSGLSGTTNICSS
jgi:hypothetical protein